MQANGKTNPGDSTSKKTGLYQQNNPPKRSPAIQPFDSGGFSEKSLTKQLPKSWNMNYELARYNFDSKAENY